VLADFTPLVGYNNAGKSNILTAIKWLLRRSSLHEKDFYDASQPLIVSGVVAGITEELLELLEEKHKSSIEPYLDQQKLHIRRTQNAPNDAASKIIFEVKQNNEDIWQPNPAGIDNAISALFPEAIEIGAMEDAEEDVSKWKTSTTIGKLISEVMVPIEEQHGAAIKEVLDGIKQKLSADGNERAPELDSFDEAANIKLQELFPGLKIKLHIPAPEIKEVFKSGTIKVYEGDETSNRDIISIGHGAQRSIQMALILHLADVKKKGGEGVSRTLLLIDEPELYLHPQAVEQVRVALKKLSIKGYQVIFATHSPLMIVSQDLCNAVLVRKVEGEGTYIRKRLADAVQESIDDAPAQTEMLMSLSNASQILFSEEVVLIEGKAEKRLFPHIYQKVQCTTLGQDKIALIKQDGVANTAKALRILLSMDLPAKAIVDLDYAFRYSIKDGYLEDDDKDIAECKKILRTLETTSGIKLNDDGLPINKESSMSASEAYAELARSDGADTHIENIHNKLIKSGIWLWKKGAFEHHLGITGKTEPVWCKFLTDLEAQDFEAVVDDHECVKGMLRWLKDKQ